MSGQSTSQVVKALEDEPAQGRRCLGVRREPALDRLDIRLVPADGEEPDDQPGGDLLTAPGPQSLKLLEVAGGEGLGQLPVSVDGEARHEGVDVVVAQRGVGQEPVEDLGLEVLGGIELEACR